MILDDIKLLLSKPEDYTDNVINYHINAVMQKIMNEYHLSEFPMNYEYVVTDVVVSRLEGVPSYVKSISSGDIKTDYTNNGDELGPYRAELEQLKCIRVI